MSQDLPSVADRVVLTLPEAPSGEELGGWGFGGEALAALPGDLGPVAVSHGIPGETVLAEIFRAPKRPGAAWRARVVEVLEPSSAFPRIDPECPFYATCPGCHLRHVPYEQVELWLKRRSVVDALGRFGGLPPASADEIVEPVRGAPSRDGYRVRARPSAQTAEGRPAMAAFGATGPPIPLDACPVMADRWRDGGGGDAAGWTLPNPAMRGVLEASVAELLDLRGDERVLEVGAGRGALTRALAPSAARWVGLDVDPASLEVGRDAMEAAGLAHKVELRAGRLEKSARRLLTTYGRFDAALLNPMRRPLGGPAMESLDALGIRRVVYVGPSPVAAARDLAVLSGLTRPLTVRRAIPVDLYPGTYHVLVVAQSRPLVTVGEP